MSGTPVQARATAEARAIALLGGTLLTEAAARPIRAVEALAAVVVNRARLARGGGGARLRFTPAGPSAGTVPWPVLVVAACRAPFLFGCWRDGTGRAAVAEATRQDGSVAAACRRIAARALAQTLSDPTDGATHWHAADEFPAWALGQVPLAEIGGLVFYRPA